MKIYSNCRWSYSKWLQSFQVGKPGFLAKDEFLYVIAVHERSMTDILAKDAIFDTLKKLADVQSASSLVADETGKMANETLEKASPSAALLPKAYQMGGPDRVSASTVKACYESLSIPTNAADRYVKRLVDRLNPAELTGEEQPSIDIFQLGEYLYEEQVRMKSDMN